MPIINSITAMHDEITAWRRDLHENPELLYDVHRTAGVVAEKLKAFGCDEVVPGMGGPASSASFADASQHRVA
jgi:metal-dependent amidase/aminoacylase/carboxypeptidase family protein